MTSPSPTVAVIDIGSNSIKLLVAALDPARGVYDVMQRTEETRLGTGITAHPPQLREDAMTRAVDSVRALVALAVPFAPAKWRIVATSAVRDAANRRAFAARIMATTGHRLEILTGNEEALGIGRGIACDPTLDGVSTFYLFDLGGGSLELLAFRAEKLEQVASLPLGCVRLTESCVTDPTVPLSSADVGRIRRQVEATLATAPFRFLLPPGTIAVATGGTATTLRLMRAAARGMALAEESPRLEVADLHHFATRLCAASLPERQQVPGMPPKRADVMPTAILTLIEIAQQAKVDTFRHSLYNLRFGLAAGMLDAGP